MAAFPAPTYAPQVSGLLHFLLLATQRICCHKRFLVDTGHSGHWPPGVPGKAQAMPEPSMLQTPSGHNPDHLYTRQ